LEALLSVNSIEDNVLMEESWKIKDVNTGDWRMLCLRRHRRVSNLLTIEFSCKACFSASVSVKVPDDGPLTLELPPVKEASRGAGIEAKSCGVAKYGPRSSTKQHPMRTINRRWMVEGMVKMLDSHPEFGDQEGTALTTEMETAKLSEVSPTSGVLEPRRSRCKLNLL